MLLQQGDVLLKKVDNVPQEAKKRNGFVLAEGEVTGHAHKIDVRNVQADLIQLYELNGELYVSTKVPVKIKHEEHKQITLPKGNWKVGKVKEYDHFSEEAREVID